MNVLVACEESQVVCTEFRKRGHLAFSCDIVPCSGGHPEWHIQHDVLPLLDGNCSFVTSDGEMHWCSGKWDLIIAHPPCTYMSNAGACRMYIRAGEIDGARYRLAMEAKEFFMACLNADCDRICVENPRPMKIIGLPQPDQLIQPYMFGDPYSKATLLWLVGLDPLMATKIISKHRPYLPSGTSKNKGTGINRGAANGQKQRSRTFQGIAEAMAEQWGRS